MLPCSHSLQFAEGDTILSCANILHVGAEAYGQLMPSFASGNNISEMGGEGEGGSKRKYERSCDKGRSGEADEKESSKGVNEKG